MKHIVKSLVLLSAIVGLSIPSVYAQEGEGAVSGGIIDTADMFGKDSKGKEALKKYDDAYDLGGFERLSGEEGKGGVITYEDYQANMKGKEDSIFAERRWNEAIEGFDANGDGSLDVNEARAYRDAERKKLIENKDALNEISKNPRWLNRHPGVAEKIAENSDYLKNHPHVADAMIENKEWLNQNPKVAEKLFENRKFLNEHREFSERLYRNRELINAHPNVAREAYKNREFLNNHPEFREDLEKHQKFLKEHPEASKRGYKASQKHPDEAKRVYKDAKDHPEKAKKVGKYADKHPDASKRAYKAGKAREGSGANKAAYKAGKSHPGAVQKGAKNPGKAKAAARSRRQ